MKKKLQVEPLETIRMNSLFVLVLTLLLYQTFFTVLLPATRSCLVLNARMANENFISS